MKDLSLHILDLAQNSVVAKATKIEITVKESVRDNIFSITISDNGKGMDADFLKKVTDPYTTSRTTRKVGLGIPLIKMNAEHCNGGFKIESEVGKGTSLTAWFEHNNIDRPALGDIAGTVVLTAAANEHIHFIYAHITDWGTYIFDTQEVKEALDGISLNDVQIIRYLREMIQENLQEINYSE